ncbi:MAG TPA: ABC transporter substrate-binding protein [Dongiaceae bacterium]|jgi:peptide/nickel transport system substrate-binding protein
MSNRTALPPLLPGADWPETAAPGRGADTGAVAGEDSTLQSLWRAGIAALEQRDQAELLLRRAEASNRAKSDLFSFVSHEVRNSISAISGYGEMIEMQARLRSLDQFAEWAININRARQHLEGLVDHVLDAAKLEAGKIAVEIEEFHLPMALAEVKAILGPFAQQRGVEFHMKVAEDIDLIKSDKLKIRQILLNLLGNAMKFTDRGEVRLDVQRRIDNCVSFEVTDTGIGMSEAEIASLFQPFTQVGAKSANARRGGSGLGLYICKSLCDLLGGRIEAQSEPGKGSRFTVLLPADAAATLAEAAERAARPELSIAMLEAMTSLDPHHQRLRSTLLVMPHVFNSLTSLDAQGRAVPALATGWRRLDDRGWEFQLRRGVRFHDGSPFSGEDVLATFARLKRLMDVPSSMGTTMAEFAAYGIEPGERLVIRTKSVWPTLPVEINEISIINRRFEQASVEDFNSLAAMVGTGPYRILSAQRDSYVRLERFDGYWAGRPEWQSVMFSVIPDELQLAEQVASGHIDVVDDLHPRAQARLLNLPDVQMIRSAPSGFYHLALDLYRDRSPEIRDRDGVPLRENPLRDPRVRLAMSLAIDRDFLCAHVMRGQAEPGRDVVPSSVRGANQDSRPDPHDPARARRLLAEAGYADGFQLDLTAPVDTPYMPLVQALSLMLTSVGIETQYVIMDTKAFYDAQFRGDLAACLTAWYDVTGEASYSLKHLLATVDPATGMGAGNVGRYSNPAFDQLLGEALASLDDERRIALLSSACALAAADRPIIPVVEPRCCWAVRKGFRISPSAYGMTWAWFAGRERE